MKTTHEFTVKATLRPGEIGVGGWYIRLPFTGHFWIAISTLSDRELSILLGGAISTFPLEMMTRYRDVYATTD